MVKINEFHHTKMLAYTGNIESNIYSV